MRIITDAEGVSSEDHAKKIVQAIRQHELTPRHSPRDIMPIGISKYQAHFPIMCDDCGETYWSRDEYGSHLGCKGVTRNTGF